MKTYQEFLNESRLATVGVMTESVGSNLLKFKKGQKMTATLEDGTEIEMDVVGYNYVVDGKLYNKSHAKFDSFDDFTSSIEDESSRKAVASGDARSLMAFGHERIKSKQNKPGEDNFALVGYQSGKTSNGYQKTVINSILIAPEITEEDAVIAVQTTMLFGTGFMLMMDEHSSCRLLHIKHKLEQ
ncbi:hypothetical protein vBKpnAMK5_00130 [Klebsiella phage vB_Kpn_AM_K5]